MWITTSQYKRALKEKQLAISNMLLGQLYCKNNSSNDLEQEGIHKKKGIELDRL